MMRRAAMCILLLLIVIVPAVRLAWSFDAHDHAAFKHARSAPGVWRNATPIPSVNDALPVPAPTWWSVSPETAGSAIAGSSAPFVPPRSG